MKFRKKPVEIEAQQFDGSNESAAAILFWIGGTPEALRAAEAGERLAYVNGNGTLFIRTLESGDGYHIASPGDWIIQGIKGEFYPCKPDIFDGSYDAVCIGVPAPNEVTVPLGVVKGLEMELAKARGEWNAEVKRLRDGRRERIAGRVMAALVSAHVAHWLKNGDIEPDHAEMLDAARTWAMETADVLIEGLDGVSATHNPPLSVPTDRVR